jgi:hypothetical protein
MGISLFAQASLDYDSPILAFLLLLEWQACTNRSGLFSLR